MGRRGYGGGGRGRVYTYCYTVTSRMTSALRWAAMRVILMFHNCERQSHKTVSTDHNFRSERRAGADSNRGSSAYQPNPLPLGQTGSLTLGESPKIVFIQTAQTMTASSPPPPQSTKYNTHYHQDSYTESSIITNTPSPTCFVFVVL